MRALLAAALAILALGSPWTPLSAATPPDPGAQASALPPGVIDVGGGHATRILKFGLRDCEAAFVAVVVRVQRGWATPPPLAFAVQATGTPSPSPCPEMAPGVDGVLEARYVPGPGLEDTFTACATTWTLSAATCQDVPFASVRIAGQGLTTARWIAYGWEYWWYIDAVVGGTTGLRAPGPGSPAVAVGSIS